ncbi:hypothetical protein [Coleofasciculus sp. FACHB-T130]|uniref:hypothetical protein n=1 Tax=Cyanophyceae TaxID=3028117 RepID=UPI001681CF36|nr:hypothetical protein [Coleofasciculus sp. FACHB-T130]MBD1879516.1 hypothetical protein [Coleofasciculus sp. FACHB-T130]
MLRFGDVSMLCQTATLTHQATAGFAVVEIWNPCMTGNSRIIFAKILINNRNKSKVISSFLVERTKAAVSHRSEALDVTPAYLGLQ